MAAGMFGAVFNTPGDVIRSAIQNRFLASEPIPASFQPVSGIKEFFSMGAEIAGTKGITALWTGFPFKALHLGGSGALLAMLIPFFKQAMNVSRE